MDRAEVSVQNGSDSLSETQTGENYPRSLLASGSEEDKDYKQLEQGEDPVCLLSEDDKAEEGQEEEPDNGAMKILKNVAVVGGIGLATFVATPIIGGAALSLIGFQAGGIAAGSLGAALMSSSAAASGGGVVAGGVVATLQTAGAVGISSGVSAITGSIASGTAALVKYKFGNNEQKQ